MRASFRSTLVLALGALALPLAAQEPKGNYETTELAPGLYMIEGVGGFGGGNVGLLTGDDGVMLIDDGLPPLTEPLLAAIGKLTDSPVDLLINTHVHGDHVGGNQVLGERGATIVAHDNLRKRLVAEGIPTGRGNAPAPPEALPVLTFADAVTVHLNGREAYVFHVEHAHTDGDVVIHFVEDNVIHAGDVLFNGLFPFIDRDSGGSLDGYIAAQERILAVADDKTKIIPGHGHLGDKASLQASNDMLKGARDRVRALVAAGKSEDEVLAANPLAEYDEKWSWRFIDTERMTKMLYEALAQQ